MFNLYNILTTYGTVYEINSRMNNAKQFVEWTENNFNYVKYNPRKDVNRYGLSITSLNGDLSGIPDLDSLYEYNLEAKTQFTEQDFVKLTPVYQNKELSGVLDPFKEYIFRTHILKLGPGGFFPPHRDFRGTNFDSFRLIIPLQNVNPPSLTFIIDDKIQYWNVGSVYFVDTAKMHYLFNSSFSPSYMIVVNVKLNEFTVNYITNNLKHK